MDAAGMHKDGLFWQNWAYPAGRSTLPAFETALISLGTVCCGGAAAKVGVIGPAWVGELVVSSHGISATAAMRASTAAVRTPRDGPPGGGVINVSVVVFSVAAIITPWVVGDPKSVAVDGFKTPTIR